MTDSKASPAVATKQFNAKYNFKTVKPNTDNHSKLKALVEAGSIPADQVEEVKEKDAQGKELIVGYKRKSLTVTLTAPDLATVLTDVMSANQINHTQYIVEKQIELANKDAVDSGSSEYVGWEAVLEAAPTQRKASTKVTNEMIVAATKALIQHLTDNTKANDTAKETTERLALRKFSVSACNKIPHNIIELIQNMLAQWADKLDDDGKLAEYEPVLTLWASEIEKTLNPQEDELTVDMFGLEDEQSIRSK